MIIKTPHMMDAKAGADLLLPSYAEVNWQGKRARIDLHEVDETGAFVDGGVHLMSQLTPDDFDKLVDVLKPVLPAILALLGVLPKGTTLVEAKPSETVNEDLGSIQKEG